MQPEITIALAKGRILDETLPLLQRAGIEALDDLTRRAAELIKLIEPPPSPDWKIWHATSFQVEGAEGFASKLRELAEELERKAGERSPGDELRLEVSATILRREPGEE